MTLLWPFSTTLTSFRWTSPSNTKCLLKTFIQYLDELVQKEVVPHATYDKIKAQLVAKRK